MSDKRPQDEPVMLSVDWDFFSTETPEMDLGHAESFCIPEDALWQIRYGDLHDKLVTNGEEELFWAKMWADKFTASTNEIRITESHKNAIHDLIEHPEVKKVILFDSHHDMWPITDDDVQCQNWLTYWLKMDSERSVIWVHPENIDPDVYEKPDVSGRQYTIMPYKTFLGRSEAYDAGLVHVCRSGAWMPPWLDNKFKTFVGSAGLMDAGPIPFDPRGETIDPMVARWTRIQQEQVAQMAEATKEAMSKIKLMPEEEVELRLRD